MIMKTEAICFLLILPRAQAFVPRQPLTSAICNWLRLDLQSSNDDTTACASSRRDFLHTVAVTSSLMIGSNVAKASDEMISTLPLDVPKPSIQLPPMGLGAWAWGDSFFWGYDKKNDEQLEQVFDYAVTSSPMKTTLIDTAEIYGFGRSESLIGEFSKKYPVDKIQVATKFAAFPTRTKPMDVVKACEESVKRLGGRSIDLYQIHFPNAWSNAEYWDGLAMAYDKGLVKAVGVSNYGVDALRACSAALAKRGIPLATNQIQLSLLYRYPLENGLMQACADLGIGVLSYSPLALGMLTGKYTANEPPSGPRQALYKNLLTTPDYENLLATMRDVAAAHGDAATVPQVALNWARAKNSIPIPGARTLSQIQQNYGALDWNLSVEETQALDAAASKVTTFIKPEQSPFAKKDIYTGLIMFDS